MDGRRGAAATLEQVGMNRLVANHLLTLELRAYRDLSFDELLELVGERSTRCVREDGVDYDLTIIVRQGHNGDIWVSGFTGESEWGSPHDTLDDTIVARTPAKGRPNL